MDYYLSEAGQTTGPFSPPQLHQRYAAKEISGDTLAYRADGSSDWQPLYRFLHHIRPSQATIQQQQAIARQNKIQRLKTQAAAAHSTVSPPKLTAQPKATSEDIRRENMKFFGWCVIGIGVLVAGYFFFFYDTSVGTESRYISGIGTIGGGRVLNQGLMQNRLLGCTAGMVALVIGTIMLVTNPKKPSA